MSSISRKNNFITHLFILRFSFGLPFRDMPSGQQLAVPVPGFPDRVP
jgi:hypothetical protein